MNSLKNARFSFNNFIDSTTLSTSSADASYPNTNLTGSIRSKVWKAGGNFEISSTNNKVYIGGTTYTLTNGFYTSATLITHFNSITGKTLSRNSNGRFVITSGSSVTVNFSSTSNAVWNTLGFLSTSDSTGTTFTADERRYSTDEWIMADLRVPQIPDFAAIIPPANSVFSCANASIYLQGNNALSWSSPIVNVAMTVTDTGAYYVPSSDLTDCRYWRIRIVDPTNNNINASVAYIGDSTITRNTNIAVGFSRSRNDNSARVVSEGGQSYFDRKPKQLFITSNSVEYLKADDLADMEQLFYDLGVGRPFFLTFDPEMSVSTSIDQMTHYVEVDSDANFSHVLNSYYNLSFTMREVL